MAEESKAAVLAAMGANFAIAGGKLAAGVITGSAALLAEAGHSVADTVNQVFLLVGLNLSRSEADERHPHGHGKETFFWAFLAAVFIFVAGAVFSIFEGVRTLVQETNHNRSATDLGIAYGVLGFAFLFETASFVVAVRQIRADAARNGWSIVRYVRESPALTLKTVLFEDSAALAGLALATLGLTVSELTHSEVWDGVASLAIGFLLAGVAILLGWQSRALLIGAATSTENLETITETIRQFPEIQEVPRLLTMQTGVSSILVTGELRLCRDLSGVEVAALIERLDRKLETALPEIHDTFWEVRPPA